MSAGVFSFVTYGASYETGVSHPIRVQPETLEAAVGGTTNDPLVGDPTNPISAIVSGSRRSLGLHARTISLALVGSPPTGYAETSRVRIPILDPDNFATFAPKNTAVTYLGTTWRVTGSSAEKVN